MADHRRREGVCRNDRQNLTAKPLDSVATGQYGSFRLTVVSPQPASQPIIMAKIRAFRVENFQFDLSKPY
jgi:hypothetical protein